MKHLLTTKILTPAQKEHLLSAGFGVVERNFIATSPIHFELKEIPENLIFTSSNAVRVLLSHPKLPELKTRKVFAVGEKTTDLLRESGFEVQFTADYASVLAEQIIRHHKKEHFLFLCGRKSLPQLPDLLKEYAVNLHQVEVYDTEMLPKKMDRIFEGVLFFSPSAVQSYTEMNDLSQTVAFCIGKTTGSEAKKYTNKVVLATRPSIENVIVQVVKYLKH